VRVFFRGGLIRQKKRIAGHSITWQPPAVTGRKVYALFMLLLIYNAKLKELNINTKKKVNREGSSPPASTFVDSAAVTEFQALY